MTQTTRSSDAGPAALFDLSFTRFITVGIIKFIYILAVAGLAIGWFVLLITGFKNGGFVGGLVAIVLGSIVFVLNLLIVRMGLELVVVIFRIGQHTERLVAAQASNSSFPVGPAA